MKSLIINYLYNLILIILAPFYFHFGSYNLFIEIISYGQELIDILGLYLLTFFFINILILNRNNLFKIYNKFFFKTNNFNKIIFLNYINQFYNNFKSLILFKSIFIK